MDNDDITHSQTDRPLQALSNHFLIAMPGLKSPDFFQSVVYICEHNANGAIGLVINHPINITLSKLFSQMDLTYDAAVDSSLHSTPIDSTPLFAGGPVHTEHGFVLHSSEKSWESTFNTSDDIGITASKDILEDMAHNRGPAKFLVALGYAGWSAGQLEHEMGANSWLTVPADKHIIFDTPTEQRWTAAALPLGVDMNLMTNQAGHA
jgi:putative transcriptional regulator